MTTVMKGLAPNQLVAYNLERARRAKGWTQDQAAEQLEPFLGARWSRASWSAAERTATTGRRQFSADEIVAFARAFDLPIGWFFLPPGRDEETGAVLAVKVADGELSAGAMLDLVFGVERHAEEMTSRLTELMRELPARALGPYERLAAHAAQVYAATIRGTFGELSSWRSNLLAIAKLLEVVETGTLGAFEADWLERSRELDAGERPDEWRKHKRR